MKMFGFCSKDARAYRVDRYQGRTNFALSCAQSGRSTNRHDSGSCFMSEAGISEARACMAIEVDVAVHDAAFACFMGGVCASR